METWQCEGAGSGGWPLGTWVLVRLWAQCLVRLGNRQAVEGKAKDRHSQQHRAVDTSAWRTAVVESRPKQAVGKVAVAC